MQTAYLSATTGGGACQVDGAEEGEGLDHPDHAPSELGGLEHFQPIPQCGIAGEDGLAELLNFKHRKRLTHFVKDLLSLPCMSEVSAAASRPGEANETVDPPEAQFRILRRASAHEQIAPPVPIGSL